MKIKFSNSHEILEPQDFRNCLTFPYADAYGNMITEPIVFDFEDDNRLFTHVLKHIIERLIQERWDDLNSFPPQRELFSILNLNSVRQILNNHPIPIDYITDEEAAVLRSIPQFTNLAERYKVTLSRILGECINHVNPECQIFNPHCHFLYDVKGSDNFAQVITIMDATSGILTAAIAPYTFNPNSSANFESRNIFVIKTGYRLWRSRYAERRTKKFKRSVKELNRKIRKLSSKRTDIKYKHRAYPHFLDNKNHYPEYINKKITNSTNTGTTNTGK